MTGMFELFTDTDTSYRFRLTAPDGTVMALSKPFADKPAAVAGIAAVREYAGMGLVTEIAEPQGNTLRRALPARIRSGTGEDNRPRRSGATGALVRPPCIRIQSAARFLRERAVTRNHQMILRWRQTLGSRTAPAEPSAC